MWDLEKKWKRFGAEYRRALSHSSEKQIKKTEQIDSLKNCDISSLFLTQKKGYTDRRQRE